MRIVSEFKKRFVIYIPALSIMGSLAGPSIEAHLSSWFGVALMEDFWTYALLLSIGAMVGTLWHFVISNLDIVKRHFARKALPISLTPACQKSLNQEGLQDGETRFQYGGWIENRSRRTVKGVRYKVEMVTCGQTNLREFCYELKEIDGDEEKFVPFLEVIKNRSSGVSQYKVLKDRDGNDAQLCGFEQPLEIFSCIATDKQPKRCEGTNRLVVTNCEDQGIAMMDKTGFDY